jgi:RNA polymerase sigma-70 factor (ECF subfamily)
VGRSLLNATVTPVKKNFSPAYNLLAVVSHFEAKGYPTSLSYQQDPHELELLRGCLRRERAAQHALYHKYKDAMYTLLYRMLDDEDDAADALQEAFIEVFKSLPGYLGKSSLGAWIKTIVIRCGLARQRKTMGHQPLDDLGDDAPLAPWDENLTGEYLDRAIRQLPEGYRNVFLLVEVEGFSHREVSETLRIAEGTSKSQLHQAKRLLQRLLREFMD